MDDSIAARLREIDESESGSRVLGASSDSLKDFETGDNREL
jgi:hypothetical protein